MFESIRYKRGGYICLIVFSTAAGAIACCRGEYFLAVGALAALVVGIVGSDDCLKRYNANILFLLNALDNGDYSFRFSENKRSVREKEMNRMLNRIRLILANARTMVIENEHFLSIILEEIDTGIIIADDRGIVQKVNRTALNFLGLPVFTHFNQLRNIDESYPAFFHSLKAGDRRQLRLVTEREELQMQVHVTSVKVKRGKMRIVSLNNIGNELESKEMESWIRLIRVMTHEIMNSIAPITSLSEIMQSHLRAEDDSTSLRNNALEAFETIASTAGGLLSFVESYRRLTSVRRPEKETVALRPLLDKTLQLNDSLLRSLKIEVGIQVPSDIRLLADPNLLHQVLINLIKNAIEALANQDERRIVVTARTVDQQAISIEIANNGTPIPKEILPQIFIPFFTTKPDGSGIGLSLSQYILRLHGGKLQHFVSKNGFTVFRILLPVNESIAC
jgi:nitrogen fixation/metabolism regulation signal transduction histidine kinase